MSFIAIQVPDIGDFDEVNAIELMAKMGFIVLALEVAGLLPRFLRQNRSPCRLHRHKKLQIL